MFKLDSSSTQFLKKQLLTSGFIKRFNVSLDVEYMNSDTMLGFDACKYNSTNYNFQFEGGSFAKRNLKAYSSLNFKFTRLYLLTDKINLEFELSITEGVFSNITRRCNAVDIESTLKDRGYTIKSTDTHLVYRDTSLEEEIIQKINCKFHPFVNSSMVSFIHVEDTKYLVLNNKESIYLVCDMEGTLYSYSSTLRIKNRIDSLEGLKKYF